MLRELRPMIGRCYKALAYKVGLSNHVSRSVGRHTVSVALTLKVQHLLSSCSGSKSFQMSVSKDGYVQVNLSPMGTMLLVNSAKMKEISQGWKEPR